MMGARRPRAALLVALSMMLVLVVARTAGAQQRIEISANVDNDTVEVGETLAYSLQVLVHGGGEMPAYIDAAKNTST